MIYCDSACNIPMLGSFSMLGNNWSLIQIDLLKILKIFDSIIFTKEFKKGSFIALRISISKQAPIRHTKIYAIYTYFYKYYILSFLLFYISLINKYVFTVFQPYKCVRLIATTIEEEQILAISTSRDMFNGIHRHILL